MSNRRTVIHILCSAATVVLLVVCFSSMLLGIFAGVLKLTVFDKQNYVTIADMPGFSQTMMSYVREELEAECLFYDLPFSVLDDAFSDDQIVDFSREYLANLYTSLVNGEEFAVPTFDVAPFIRAVDSFFSTLPTEEKPFDTTVADTVGTELAAITSSLLQGGIDETYVKWGNRLLGNRALHNFAQSIFVFLIIDLIVIATLLVLSSRQWWYRLYTICFTLGISSAVCFIPFWLLKRYDLMARLVLAESPFKLYVDSLYHSVLNEALLLTGVIFAICTVIFIASIVVVCAFKKRDNSTQNVHANGIDECA